MSDTAQTPGGIHPALAGAWDQASAAYGQTSKAMGMMNKVQNELGALAKMGSAITPEDVIQGAGKLVGAGASPMELASLMSDMPTTGGDALAGWVAMHAEQAKANAQQLSQAHMQASHSLGVASVHKLAAHALQPASQAPAAPAASPSLGQAPSSMGVS